MNIKWTDKITNEELWRITKQKPIEIQIKRRKWNWIGHTLRKEAAAIEKTALDWNPQGYRRGRPKRTWPRTIEDAIRNTGRLYNEVRRGQLVIATLGSSSWMPCAPQGVKGLDDYDDDTIFTSFGKVYLKSTIHFAILGRNSFPFKYMTYILHPR